jgi:hypothetical protein
MSLLAQTDSWRGKGIMAFADAAPRFPDILKLGGFAAGTEYRQVLYLVVDGSCLWNPGLASLAVKNDGLAQGSHDVDIHVGWICPTHRAYWQHL